ncbi:MAG: SRPBCC domain-containing protein [Hyphomonadaceae bacterium]
MSEAKKTAAGSGDKQVYKVVINAPIETVWNTLVKTDEVLPFFFGSVCETKDGLKPGRKMRMATADRKFVGVVGEVLEFSPPHRYSHTMAFTHFVGEPPSTVTYELKEVPGGTEFSLITSNVPAGTKSEKSMAQGGPFIVQNLKKLVETGKPAFSGRMVMMLSPMMGMMTPKVCRIQNWPLD